MATLKVLKFCDLPDGSVVELKDCYTIDNQKFLSAFPGLVGIKAGPSARWVGYPTSGPDCVRPVTRMIDYKRYASKHTCNAKCLGGKINGTCECSCGGENHGRGIFTSLVQKG